MDRFLEYKDYCADIFSKEADKIIDLFNASLGHDERFSWVIDKYEGVGTVDIYYENNYVLTITTLSVADIEEGNKRLFGILVNWEKLVRPEWMYRETYDPNNTYYPIDLGQGIYMVKKKSELIDLKFSGNFKESSEYLLKFSLNFNPNE